MVFFSSVRAGIRGSRKGPCTSALLIGSTRSLFAPASAYPHRTKERHDFTLSEVSTVQRSKSKRVGRDLVHQLF